MRCFAEATQALCGTNPPDCFPFFFRNAMSLKNLILLFSVWSIKEGRELKQIDAGAAVACLGITPDGRMLTVGTKTKQDNFRIWLRDLT
jgi:hypothetical protein